MHRPDRGCGPRGSIAWWLARLGFLMRLIGNRMISVLLSLREWYLHLAQRDEYTRLAKTRRFWHRAHWSGRGSADAVMAVAQHSNRRPTSRRRAAMFAVRIPTALALRPARLGPR